MIIMGVDPGSQIMGVAIIRDDPKLVCMEINAHILGHNKPRNQRLLEISEIIVRYLDLYNPDVLAIEDQYVGCNRRGSLHLAEAKGAVNMEAYKRHIPLIEYAPSTVKKSATGSGDAGKPDVKNFVSGIFRINLDRLPFDASDALAIALCHSNKSRGEQQTKQAIEIQWRK